MPDLVGISLPVALTIIANEGIPWPPIVDHVPNNSVPADTVVAQSPDAGVPIPCDTVIYLDVAYNYPICWDYLSLCHGDADNSHFINNDDWPSFRDSYYKSYGQVGYIPCGDYDRNGIVNNDDWPAFRDNYYKTVASNCTPGDPLGVYDPD
jgi:hypothetical protein